MTQTVYLVKQSDGPYYITNDKWRRLTPFYYKARLFPLKSLSLLYINNHLHQQLMIEKFKITLL